MLGGGESGAPNNKRRSNKQETDSKTVKIQQIIPEHISPSKPVVSLTKEKKNYTGSPAGCLKRTHQQKEETIESTTYIKYHTMNIERQQWEG